MSTFGERRRHHRYTINRIAKFRPDDHTLARDCMISDISRSGARLFAEGVPVPDTFNLLISADDREVVRHCKVVWRLGNEVGVQFTDRAAADCVYLPV